MNRLILKFALTLVMTLGSSLVLAEEAVSEIPFDHMSTGFPLSGGHATTSCDTCHAGGVLKGTPRNCSGCHAVGQRSLATPKSNSHLVTDSPCETCHFNSFTFLGARFNHGAVIPGQCDTCHNGRVAANKSARHIATTAACDQCHRSSAWIPATWNHTGAQYVGQDCKVCHNGGAAVGYTSARHGVYSGVGITACNVCHKNYVRFYSPYPQYNHSQPSTVDCTSCHNGMHAPIKGIPSSHNLSLLSSPNCLSCHSIATWGQRMNHGVIAAGTQCKTCHLRGATNFAGMRQVAYGHKGMTAANDCVPCHSAGNFSRWGD
jgi:hypothetical protein